MTIAPTASFSDQLDALLVRAERSRRGSRREGDRLRPLGPKATRTRAAIIDAGIEVFCRHGYQASSVGAVHERAGVSLGTFYQYFRDKADLVVTIVAEAVIASADRMFRGFDAERGEAGVAAVVDGFVRHYAATAEFQRVWEEVFHLEPGVADLRTRLSEVVEASFAESIAVGQAHGEVDASLEPRLTARALAAMVDRTCFLTFVIDGAGRDAVPEVTATLTQLWANALRLETA
ncbi:MAG: TetR/AcrR family transcriptional regulator [Acidimicrobiia bacterium]